MADEPNRSSSSSANETLEHMLEEVEHLEGVGDKGRWIRWALIVIVLAAIVGGVYYMQRSAPKRTPLKNVGAPIELQEPGAGKLAQPPDAFKWQSVAGRHHYVLTVGTSAGGKDVLDEIVKSNQFRPEPSVIEKLTPGRRYYWKVTAVAKDGRLLGQGEGRFDL